MVSGFQVPSNPEPGRWLIDYKTPEPTEVTLQSGTCIGIGFAVKGPNFKTPNTVLQIEQSARVNLTSEATGSFEQLHGEMLQFLDFVSIGVGQPVKALALTGSIETTAPPSTEIRISFVKIYLNGPNTSPNLQDVFFADMTFTLLFIRNRFSEMVAAWFNRNEAIGPLYQLYFGTVRSPFMYVEHRLFNMFQALESYDRRRNEPSIEEIQKHEDRTKRILASIVEGKDKAWLKNRLKRNETQASDRINRLVQEFAADWLLTKEDVEQATLLRNHYTHYDINREKDLPPIEDRPKIMHNLALRLQLLVETIFLSATGFSNDEVRERLQALKRLEYRLAK